MKDPCKTCVVVACCSKCCNDKADWILDTGEYKQFGDNVTQQIEQMKRTQAINHIVMCEDIAKSISI